MFTGIVEEVGEIVDVRTSGDVVVLTVRGPRVSTDAAHGDSIAVNGCCLTVVDEEGASEDLFRLELVPETLKRTSLGAVVAGSKVNLERALPAGGRLGGHIVQGHVDGVGTLLGRTPGERSDEVRFSLPAELSRYVVEKGSICVDGVSLTVAGVDADSFTVALIPTTLADTTLGRRRPGDPVNLEVDIVAKYVERLTAGYTGGVAEEARS
ncbi:MAG: riboflavin synthase, alpha subunit [Pseudonocardia sp.]|jgi:riboflavin synthase|uniref:riboflavin synthase n=1 Tax=Pseudonocardia sp. TaxID=60912 RepID=UPI00262D5AE7|nr:riboflavin synthase [Pseudonocardia sp.]MCU1627873.1 riboflavin synthase, alpha subunit [Pseudonocardia sp.]MDT7704114.1 riboflavin synthase [Pseudonocardiales bacterium]HEV7470343.1 riboflavin synthase [Pseudonocardia sp.]